ncbi:glycerophosphoryl diester phosphodiesterase [Leifsonia xyli subsp. cynodontis DSM 46306]|uniref:Mannitol dehydrogenase N-terminal domain-containing protein n=1 Tax=Leifsonia xyli subsp. cynodontis DSM 46306 TaxID=1389489 RepID=U3P911_LEIXC|nr:glycerophosphoryl diester phosphodiesterase [Leifsonia xyli subsp. cynodontis DSM 46306]
MEALSSVHDGADADAWRRVLADPEVGVLILTVTEAGYAPGSAAPARVLDGLRARFQARSGGIAVVSCDNLPENGAVIRDAVLALLAPDADPDFAAWLRSDVSDVSFVSSMVDRITPTAATDRVTVRRLTGWDDAAPVVAEPFAEWVLAGAFPAGRRGKPGERASSTTSPPTSAASSGSSTPGTPSSPTGASPRVTPPWPRPSPTRRSPPSWRASGRSSAASCPSTPRRWTPPWPPSAPASATPASSTASSRSRPTARASSAHASSTRCAPASPPDGRPATLSSACSPPGPAT